ncbi:MAG: Mur ligase family protein [bacterium]|nr:Mur ligase family protein [bacterium]
MSNSQKILQFVLKVLAKRTIRRYKPVVIGVTGSAGKTMAKEAIHAVLSRKFNVRKNEENFNNELGVPLTVLGIDPKLSTANLRIKNWPRLFRFWREIIKAKWRTFGLFDTSYPEMLVLELAAAKPGDIDYLVDIVHPKVGVVTTVGDVPVHVEFYAGPEDVAKEKSRLIESLPLHDGLAVLNYDDQTVLDMRGKTGADIMTFGLNKGADLWASGISYFIDESGDSIGGLSFKINQGKTFIPFRLGGAVGTHQIYSALAAISVGMYFGVNLVEASMALEKMPVPKHRMTLLEGVKNSLVVDDTYNASPIAVHAGLETLRSLGETLKKIRPDYAGRKIAVLGDMKELGQYTEQAHRAIGNLAGERCDILVTIGSASKFIADSAGNQMPKENILSFSTSEEAGPKVLELLQEGDVVLVKGSHSMQMDIIVDKIKISV